MKTVGDGDFTVCIVRLSPFNDIERSSPHIFLYHECRAVLPAASIDFAWFPTARERQLHEGDRDGWLTSVFTKRPLAQFDLLLISNAYALELVNLPYLLTRAGIALSASERRQAGFKPLIVLGGSNSLAAQSVTFSDKDALVDAIHFGEGETLVSALVETLKTRPGAERRTALEEHAASVDGLVVFTSSKAPSRVTKAVYRSMDRYPIKCANDPPLFDSDEASTIRLQISAGCPSFCTFCFEGWERKPYREVPYRKLVEDALYLKQTTGADSVELTSFNFNTHSDIVALIVELQRYFKQVDFMSQRADVLAIMPALASFEAAAGKRVFTVGIEGISERMRAYYHKELSRDQIMGAIEAIVQAKAKEIKLFFILSGNEDASDGEEFRRLLISIDSLRSRHGSHTRIVCSFGLLVRMPFTPLRYERLLLDRAQWEQSLQVVQEAVQSACFEFRLAEQFDEYFISQTLVMTPYPIAPALVAMAENGYVYDRKFPKGAWQFFSSVLGRQGWLPDSFTQLKDQHARFAFDFLDVGIDSVFLYNRFIDAQNHVQQSSCMPASHEIRHCSACGACSDAAERQFLTGHAIKAPTRVDMECVEALLKAKATMKPLYIRFTVPFSLRTAKAATRSSYIMRTLAERLPGAATSIMQVQDVLFGSPEWQDRMIAWYGKTAIAVYPLPLADREALQADLQAIGYPVLSLEQAIGSRYAVSIEPAEGKHLTMVMMERSIAKLLDQRFLPASLVRQGNDAVFSFSEKARKKREIFEAIIRTTIDGKVSVELQGSAKLDLSPLGKATCGLPDDSITACMRFIDDSEKL
ncbi:MAG TPA: hypothetical protein PLQ90_08655 [Sphaerochaeta sp.]|nr:hypothetical protein [Sphaerochaeta sp.]